MSKEFIVGMDGGGTATVVTAYSKEGSCLGEWKAGPINVNGQSYEKTESTISDIISLLEKAQLHVGDCKGICIGAAGISNPDTAAILTKVLQGAGMEGTIKLVGDQETALAAAFPELWGVILIAGTGSICYGRDKNGTAYRTGGYGHIIDDAGSGYAIGRDILQAVVRGYDGRIQETVLTENVYKALNIASIEELIAWLYAPSRTKKEIAALAPMAEMAVKGVLDNTKKDATAISISDMAAGDMAATAILDKAAEELVSLAAAMLKKIPEANKIVLSGSVLLKNKIVKEKFTDSLNKLYPKVAIEEMKENAAIGAVRIIKRELGW